jgi:hypothetical protein
MTKLSGSRVIKDGDRLYPYVSNLSILVDGIYLGVYTVLKVPIPPPFQGLPADFHSRLFPLVVRLPIGGPFYGAIEVSPPDKKPNYEVTFAPAKVIPSGAPRPGFKDILQTIFPAYFVLFYENYQPWIAKTYTSETNNWPSLFRFSWAMRNAAVHHGGQFFVRDQTRPPLTWHSLTYKPKVDVGRLALGDDLSVADILILMFEMSDELDALGCPI